MRRPAVVLAALCAVAVLALLAVGQAQRSSLAFAIGVAPAIPVAELAPGQEMCQSPISVPAGGAFDRIEVRLGRPGAELEAQVRDRAADGRVISRGTGGQVIAVDEVPAGRDVDVCVINRGSGKAVLLGNADAASRSSSGFIDGQPAGADLTLVFERSPRSLLGQAGTIADRTSLFKLGWIGGWAIWLLAALVVLAVPVLLVRAVRELE